MEKRDSETRDRMHTIDNEVSSSRDARAGADPSGNIVYHANTLNITGLVSTRANLHARLPPSTIQDYKFLMYDS